MQNAITTTTQAQQVNDALLMDYLMATTPGLNDNQVKQFLAVSMAFGLNPWKKEIYAVTYNSKDGSKTMSIVTGYEVYLKRAEMNPNYDGYETEWHGSFIKGKVNKSGKNGNYQVDALVPKDGEDVSCICKVYRKDRRVPVSCEVFFSEYDQGNSMWQSKPRVMLEKVAIARAFRLAFPVEFGGMPYESAELPEHHGLDPEKEIKLEGAIAEHEQQSTGSATVEVNVEQGDARKERFIGVCSKMIPAAIKEALRQYGVEKLEQLKADQLDNFYRDAKKLEDAMKQEVNF